MWLLNDKANLKSTQLANGESIEWKNYQWFSPTEINTPNVKQQNQYDALIPYQLIRKTLSEYFLRGFYLPLNQ